VAHHTRSDRNAARINRRYLTRVGRAGAHSVFRTPNPHRLIERALRRPTETMIQERAGREARVIVLREFAREIGRNGERVLKVVISSRTGRIITAYPIPALVAALAPAAVGTAFAFG
jgi:hypothetical protein